MGGGLEWGDGGNRVGWVVSWRWRGFGGVVIMEGGIGRGFERKKRERGGEGEREQDPRAIPVR